MTRTTAERRYLYRVWLDLWENASRPVIDVGALSYVNGFHNRTAAVFDQGSILIEHSGTFAQHRFGPASLLRICSNGLTITDLVCPLVGFRERSTGLVAVRSGVGATGDIRCLADRIEKMHIKAALCWLEPGALAGFTSPEARTASSQIEAAIIRTGVSSRVSNATQDRAMRL